MDLYLPPEDEIDEDGSLQLREYTVDRGGNWRVHMNDPDDAWPSDFHAHNLDDGREKLDLYTGSVFDASTGMLRRQLKKKVMRYIFKELEGCGNAVIEARCRDKRSKFTFLPNQETD